MGPIRRRLIIGLFALVPSQATANGCATLRPNWDGAPSTAITEAIALFSTTPSIILLIATAAALRFKSTWGGLVTVVGWALWIYALASPTLFPDKAAATQEGCIGPDTLFIALVIAICVVIVLMTSPKRAADENGEN